MNNKSSLSTPKANFGKNLLYLLVSVIILTINCNYVFSQKKSIDLSIVPLTPDSTVLGDSTNLLIQFKINYPDSIQNIVMKFGTEQDSANVAILNPSIIYSNSKYYLSYNNQQNEIIDYETRVYYTLSEAQLNTYNYMSLHVGYIDGASDNLYWLKKTQTP